MTSTITADRPVADAGASPGPVVLTPGGEVPQDRPNLAPLVSADAPPPPGARARHVLIIGGGYVGLYTALTLQKRLRAELARGEVMVTVVDPRSYMTYQPFLPETAAGSLEARQVVVSLRRELRRCTIINGRLVSLDHPRRCARIEPSLGAPYELAYDQVVIAPGSIARILPIPGLAETGIGFKQVEEAIGLRNHILHRLDIASSTSDPAIRARALTFVFVGGGYAGIEAFAELQDMAHYATRYYPNLTPADMRWLLVEASPRILAEVSASLADYTVGQLRARGMDIRLSTRLDSCVGGEVKLSDGTSLTSDTVVWTAGVRPNPVLAATGFRLDQLRRIRCTADLRVRDVPDAWSAGDCAAVPDLTRGDGSLESPTCAPNAQHAVRQAAVLGRNIVRSLRGEPLHDYRHAYAGSVASLGLYKGVAEVYGIKLRGFPAWFMHRTYHVSRMPTTNRKVRIIGEWTLGLLFRRDVVSIGELTMPTGDFRRAADPVEAAAGRGPDVAGAARHRDDLGRDLRVDRPVSDRHATDDPSDQPTTVRPAERGEQASAEQDRTAPQATQ